MNIFANTASVLWEHGLPVIPLRGKKPFTTGWNIYCTDFPDEATREAWLASCPNENIGLPLGPAAGICMIDIDTDDEELQKAILGVLPPSPWARIGKKGMALAYRWSGALQLQVALRGRHDLRAPGSGQSAGPATVDPSGDGPALCRQHGPVGGSRPAAGASARH